jgi:HPt (histidine-containing phosphotransfer) domain-containing protein
MVDATTHDLPVFQLDQLLGRCMGNGALAKKVVNALVATLPDDCVAMDQLAQTQQWEALARRAHRLKGAAANVGATAISHTASDIETASREKEPKRLGSLLNELQTGAARLQATVARGLEIA